MLGEMSQRFKECVIDESIAELNGREVIRLNAWVHDAMEREMHELEEHFDAMFENVNYHLAEANR